MGKYLLAFITCILILLVYYSKKENSSIIAPKRVDNNRTFSSLKGDKITGKDVKKLNQKSKVISGNELTKDFSEEIWDEVEVKLAKKASTPSSLSIGTNKDNRNIIVPKKMDSNKTFSSLKGNKIAEKNTKKLNQKSKVISGNELTKDFSEEMWDDVEVDLRKKILTPSSLNIDRDYPEEEIPVQEYKPQLNRIHHKSYTTSEFRDFESNTITQVDSSTGNYVDNSLVLSGN